MKLPNDIKCNYCKRIFCCSKCRNRHEINFHPEINNQENIICEICQGLPVIQLQRKNSEKFLDHLFQKHFPVKCNKCLKMFKIKSDLQTIAKCERTAFNNHNNVLEEIKQNSKNIQIEILENIDNGRLTKNNCIKIINKNNGINNHANVIVKEHTRDIVMDLLTPVSGDTFTWNQSSASNKRSNLTDSVSSLRNVSSINNSSSMQKTGGNTGSPRQKLVRQTSTPMQRLLISNKPTMYDSNSSSIHVSAIHSSSSESDINVSPSGRRFTNTKHLVRTRNKLPVVATPLRQVMSKSIQRAIAEHNSASQSQLNLNASTSQRHLLTTTPSPLDLRTSPVIRRTQFQLNYKEYFVRNEYVDRFIQTSRFQLTTPKQDSLNNTRMTEPTGRQSVLRSSSASSKVSETIFETCSLSDEMESDELLERNGNAIEIVETPKLSFNLKKTSSFAERNLMNDENFNNNLTSNCGGAGNACVTEKSHMTDEQYDTAASIIDDNDDCDDVWGTPLVQPHYSYKQKNSFSYEDEEKYENDNVFISADNTNLDGKSYNNNVTRSSSIWKIVSSVVNKITSIGSSEDIQIASPPLIRRCTSFSNEFLRRTKLSVESPSSKRRLTSVIGPPPKRIQGRLPIERMRKK